MTTRRVRWHLRSLILHSRIHEPLREQKNERVSRSGLWYLAEWTLKTDFHYIVLCIVAENMLCLIIHIHLYLLAVTSSNYVQTVMPLKSSSINITVNTNTRYCQITVLIEWVDSVLFY